MDMEMQSKHIILSTSALYVMSDLASQGIAVTIYEISWEITRFLFLLSVTA